MSCCGPGRSAEFLGSDFFMQIKHLHDHDSSMTGSMPRRAWIGAPVEFPRRASRGIRRV